MTKFETGPARVPDQLVPLIDEHFLETQERWQDASLFEVLPFRPELEAVDIGEENVRIARMQPEDADGTTIALSFPFQQPLNETMLLRAAFMQQAVAPNSEVLLFPNIHKGPDQSFTFSTQDKARLAEGSLAPLGEKYARVLEKLRVGPVALTGYSQGARTSLEIAAVRPDVHVTRVNADEMPTKQDRDAKQLQKDFMSSGGFGMQRKSMAEAGFGRLLKEYAGAGLVVDYAKFGVASLGEVSKLLHQAMTGSAAESLDYALAFNSSLKVKLGKVAGSELTDWSDFIVVSPVSYRARAVTYTGKAANKHTTGDNYAAHALMVKDGLQ